MRQFLLTGVAVVAMSFAMGCGSADVFHQDQRGGTITLQGSLDGAMDDAHDIMDAHCGVHGYQIVSRGKVEVGSQSYTRRNTDYGEVKKSSTNRRRRRVTRGNVQTDQVSGTVPVYEERVTYACGK